MTKRDEEYKSNLLRQVEALGNVSEACRRLGIDRSVYYRLLRSRERGDSAGSRAGSSERDSRVIAVCLQNPEWGCDRVAYYLTLTGHPLSSPTAQKIMIRHGYGRKEARLAASASLRSAGSRE